jgi:periplasmic protein CpxP/Spy
MKLRHLLITASLLTGLSAMAQTAPTSDTAVTPGGVRQTGPMQKMRDMMGRRHAQDLEALKVSLTLKPEQESQWTAFAASMKVHSPEQQHFAMAEMDKLTAPERIDKMTAWKAQRDAEMQKRGDATKTFYATLSDEQKKTFDQHTGKFMRRMAQGQRGGPGHMLHNF